MFSAILVLCSLELNTCQTVANPSLYASESACLQTLAVGYAEAEENGWTIIQYTCLDWDAKRS